MGKQYNQLLRNEFFFKLYITSTQILNLFTTFIQVLPPLEGIIYIPRMIHYEREAGTAYTIGGATALDLRWTNPRVALRIAPSPQFLDNAARNLQFLFGPQTSTGSAVAASLGAADSYVGRGLELAMATANVTGGTGGLFMTLFYEQWPFTIPFS